MLYDATYLLLDFHQFINQKEFSEINNYLLKSFKIYEYHDYTMGKEGFIIKPLPHKKGCIKRLKNWLYKKDLMFSLTPTVYEVKI